MCVCTYMHSTKLYTCIGQNTTYKYWTGCCVHTRTHTHKIMKNYKMTYVRTYTAIHAHTYIHIYSGTCLLWSLCNATTCLYQPLILLRISSNVWYSTSLKQPPVYNSQKISPGDRNRQIPLYACTCTYIHGRTCTYMHILAHAYTYMHIHAYRIIAGVYLGQACFPIKQTSAKNVPCTHTVQGHVHTPVQKMFHAHTLYRDMYTHTHTHTHTHTLYRDNSKAAVKPTRILMIHKRWMDMGLIWYDQSPPLFQTYCLRVDTD